DPLPETRRPDRPHLRLLPGVLPARSGEAEAPAQPPAGGRPTDRDRVFEEAGWGPPIERQKTKPWITNEAVQMKKDHEIPADIGISKFARELERRMREAAKTDRSVRPVKWTYLKNHLSEWDLWPVSKIKIPRNS